MSEHTFEQFSSQLSSNVHHLPNKVITYKYKHLNMSNEWVSKNNLLFDPNFVMLHETEIIFSKMIPINLMHCYKFSEHGPKIVNCDLTKLSTVIDDSYVMNKHNIIILYELCDKSKFYYGKKYNSKYGVVHHHILMQNMFCKHLCWHLSCLHKT